LTKPGFSHSISLDICNKIPLIVDVYSNISTPHCIDILQLNFDDNSIPQVQRISSLKVKSHPRPPSIPPVIPELFSFTNSNGISIFPSFFRLSFFPLLTLFPFLGVKIFGALYKPKHSATGEKFPVVVSVYGGPHVQLVGNDYTKMITRYPEHHLWPFLGLGVLVVDGMGSNGRGLVFEGVLRCAMGTVEISDQVEGLLHCADKGVDLSRVAIQGWSYGGYLSLMAIAQRGDVFKKALVGAPVTHWEAYDTGYTERYMDLPNLSPAGYRLGSVLSYVPMFPNEEGRLLIVHGLMDENVHFCHTSLLIEKLAAAGKPYDLQVYPNERHGLRNLQNYIHFKVKTLSFFRTL
jgi:dipeptidyl-peptidase 9